MPQTDFSRRNQAKSRRPSEPGSGDGFSCPPAALAAISRRVPAAVDYCVAMSESSRVRNVPLRAVDLWSNSATLFLRPAAGGGVWLETGLRGPEYPRAGSQQCGACPQKFGSPSKPKVLLVPWCFVSVTGHRPPGLRIANSRKMLLNWRGRRARTGTRLGDLPGSQATQQPRQPCHPTNRAKWKGRPRRTELSSHSSPSKVAAESRLFPPISPPHGIPADPDCLPGSVPRHHHHHGPPLSQRWVSNLSPAWRGRSCRCCPEHWRRNVGHCAVSSVLLVTWLQSLLASRIPNEQPLPVPKRGTRSPWREARSTADPTLLLSVGSHGRPPILRARGPAPLRSTTQRPLCSRPCIFWTLTSYTTLPRVLAGNVTARTDDSVTSRAGLAPIATRKTDSRLTTGTRLTNPIDIRAALTSACPWAGLRGGGDLVLEPGFAGQQHGDEMRMRLWTWHTPSSTAHPWPCQIVSDPAGGHPIQPTAAATLAK